MSTSDLIGFKALEADFFLSKMHAANRDLFEFRCYVSAFVSATNGLLALATRRLGEHQDYPAWWITWDRRLRANRIASFFMRLKPEALRIGHTPVHLDRSHWVRFGLWESKHHFVSETPEEEVPDLDVVQACTEYLTLLAEMVLDCFEKFDLRTPPGPSSVPMLARLGVTVDDIEESLGFPRGWTAEPGHSDQARLASLRRYAPDSPIDRFFLRYLNRIRRTAERPQDVGRP